MSAHVSAPAKQIRRMAEQSRQNWSYAKEHCSCLRTPGAFRCISVSDMLSSTSPAVCVFEWGGDIGVQPVADENFRPNYAAISHVWKASDAVKGICKGINRPLNIETEKEGLIQLHEISWHGLVQAAHAAKELKCDYIWLDLFCLDQVHLRTRDEKTEDEEKALQIKNMRNIYERAKAVIIMVGGIGAAQEINQTSSWIDRAWTLQEAVVGQNTQMLINWPQKYPNEVSTPPLFSGHELHGVDNHRATFQRIGSAENLALIDLKSLLKLELIGSPGPRFPDGFGVRCFSSNTFADQMDNLKPNSARMALLAVLEAENEEMRQCGLWRSSFCASQRSLKIWYTAPCTCLACTSQLITLATLRRSMLNCSKRSNYRLG